MIIKLDDIPNNYNIEKFYNSINGGKDKKISIIFKNKTYKIIISLYTNLYKINIGDIDIYYFVSKKNNIIEIDNYKNNGSNTEILYFIETFLKKFNVKKIIINDISNFYCKNNSKFTLFYIKLLETNDTYYVKNKLTIKEYNFIDFFRSIKINDCIIECNNIINICTYIVDNNCYNSFYISDKKELLNYDILKNVIRNRYFNTEKNKLTKIKTKNVVNMLFIATYILYLINYHKNNIDNKNDLFYKCLVDIFNSKNNCDNYINIFTADIIYCIYHKKQQYFIKLFYYLRYFENIKLKFSNNELLLTLKNN